MSPDSSANNCLTGDRFAPYKEAEDSLRREIAGCNDVEGKEKLTWKLAIFFLETARPEKAIAHLQWIVDAARNEENRNGALRILRFLSGSEENAISTLDDNHDLPRVLWDMGNSFLEKGNQQPGVLCLLRLLDVSSDEERRAECFLLLGVECEKVEDHDSAEQLYQRGIECGPKEIRTRYFLRNNLGYCLNHLGRHEEAEKMCRDAIEIDPRRHNAYKNLGLALQGQGEFPEAAACFIKAAFIFPLDPRSICHLEEILADHREEVEREIPDIDGHLVVAIEARNKLMR